MYHAGANGLNDCVWAPTFGLPTISTMLQMIDTDSFMQDRDMGEMFLLFPLHERVRKFTGVDVGALKFSDKECASRWL